MTLFGELRAGNLNDKCERAVVCKEKDEKILILVLKSTSLIASLSLPTSLKSFDIEKHRQSSFNTNVYIPVDILVNQIKARSHRKR